MATLPTPRTWTAGEVDTAAYMNGIRDALNFLLNPPLLILQQQTAQTMSGSSMTNITWDTETLDTDNAHAAGSANIIPLTPGWYLPSGHVAYASGTTGNRYTEQFLNGVGIGGTQTGPATMPSTGGLWTVPIVGRAFQVNGTTDTYTVAGQSATNTVNAGGQYWSSLTVVWIHA